MAKNETVAERRRRLSITSESQEDQGGEPLLSADDAEEEQFLAEIGEAPGDSIVHVHKMNVDGKDVKIWKGSPAQFDLDSLSKKFGSGDYRVMLYGRVDGGQIVRKRHNVISILLAPEEDARIRALREGRVSDQSAGGFSLEMLTAAIRAAMPTPATIVTPQNQLGLLKEMAEVLRAVMPAPSAQAQAPQAITASDLLGVVVTMLQKRASGEDDEDDYRPARGQRPGGYDLLISLVNKFAPTLQKAMEGQAVTEAPAALSGPVNSVASQSTTAASAEENAMSKLKSGLAFLVGQAARGADPELYADLVLDMVPEKEIRGLIENPAWIETLASFDPGVRKHAKWFEELKEAITDALNSPPEDATG